jgi:hypothetical protein
VGSLPDSDVLLGSRGLPEWQGGVVALVSEAQDCYEKFSGKDAPSIPVPIRKNDVKMGKHEAERVVRVLLHYAMAIRALLILNYDIR